MKTIFRFIKLFMILCGFLMHNVNAQKIIPTSPGSLQATIDQLATMTDTMIDDIIIELSGGDYYLTKTIELTNKHSGKNGFHVIFRNAIGEKPVIHGGSEILGWKAFKDDPRGDGKVITLFRAAISSDLQLLSNIVINNEQGVRTREPDVNIDVNGDWDFKNVTKDEICELTPVLVNDLYEYNVGHIPRIIDGLDLLSGTIDFADVQLVDHLRWYCEKWNLKGVSTYNTKQVTIELDDDSEDVYTSNTPLKNKVNKIGFFLENAYQFIDQPGEWFIDKNEGFIYYYPKADETLSNISAIAPTLEQLIIVNGASYIKFYGLEFGATNSDQFAAYGFRQRQGGLLYKFTDLDRSEWASRSSPQLALPAQVNLVESHHITFERNVFRHSIANGMNVQGGSHDVFIVGNVFNDLGDTGIYFGHTASFPKNVNDLVHNLVISDNHFEDLGTILSGSTGIFGGYAANTYIDRNHIIGTGNLGINANWGSYTDFRSHHGMNKIRRNRIEYIGLRHGDLGNIHTKSASPGTEIFENIFANTTYTAYSVGLPKPSIEIVYLDDGASYQNVWDNYYDKATIGLVSSEIGTKGTPTYFIDYKSTGLKGIAINNRVGNGISHNYLDVNSHIDNLTKVLGVGNPTEFEYMDTGLTDDFEAETVGKRASKWFEYRGLMTVANDEGNHVLQTESNQQVFSNQPSVMVYGLGSYTNVDISMQIKLPGSIPNEGDFYLMSRYEDFFNSLQVGYDFATQSWKVREKELLEKDYKTLNRIFVKDTHFSQNLTDITITEVGNSVSKGKLLSPDTWYNLRLVLNGDQLKFYVNDVLIITRTVNNLDWGSIGLEFSGLHQPLYFDNFSFIPMDIK